MGDFREAPIAGTRYVRCHRIVVNNSRGATPTMAFEEESVVIVGEQVIASPATQALPPCVFNPADVIELLDPTTGAPLGRSVTELDVQVILFSAYMRQLKRGRDDPTVPKVAP
jgi:hypothetical protein